MRTKALARTTAALTERSIGTINDYIGELQSGGLLSKGSRGRNGGAEMTATDKINALLAAVLIHPRGVSPAESVRRFRDLPMRHAHFAGQGSNLPLEDNIRSAFQFVRGLSIHPLDNLGAALDGLMGDLLSGAFDRWAEGVIGDAVLEFHDDRRALLVIDRPQFRVAAAFPFGDTEKPDNPIERITRIRIDAFRRLATGEAT